MYTQKRQTRLLSQQTKTKGLYSIMESIHLHTVFSYKSIVQSGPYKNCPYIESKPFLDRYAGLSMGHSYLSHSHPIVIYACPVPSHGTFPTGFP